MKENFKRKNIFFLFILLVILSCNINAQNNENESSFNWDGINDLDDVNIPGYKAPDDSWDHASLYWDTEPNEYISNYDDIYSIPEYYFPKDEKEVPKERKDENVEKDGDKQAKSEVILTKKVLPGETHTQSVKVLRDPANSSEKKVIDLIVNGVKVGTVTFSAPLKDAKGVDIYSKMTVQVFSNCPVAITTITFDNPETSTYEGSQHSTNGNLDNALTDLSLYRDLGIVNFTAPINEEENIIFTGSFTAANFSDDKKDPCLVAKELTALGVNPVFKKAVQDITITPDFHSREYSISLGKNIGGQIYAGEMKPGGKSNAEVNHYIEGFFVNLHNHPSYTIHSGIDLYNITLLNKLYPNYTGGIVLPNKEQVYAAVVTDLAAAQAFVAKYLSNPKTKGPTHYPDFMYTEMAQVLNDMDSYSIESESRAKAFVINKYNGGVTFFTQNSSGGFYPLMIKETKQANGSKKYTLIPCT